MAVKTKKAPANLTMAKIVGSEMQELELADIVSNDAQSRGMGVLSRLFDMGYGLFERISTDKDFIWNMIFSDKAEDVSFVCNLIEENEPELVDLAVSQRNVQLEPVGVWEREKGGGYDAIFGMRRILARAYNHAKHGDDATIEAKVFVFDEAPTPSQLKLMALEENANRQDESPIDLAMTYQWLTKQGLDGEAIGKRIGKSGQYVRNYIKLLDKKLEDKLMDIHSGKLRVDPALKLLEQRKSNRNGSDAGNRGAGDKGANRFRLPGTKGIIKLYERNTKPKNMEEEEWNLWIRDDVREFLAYKLGLRFEKYVPAPEKEPKKPKGKVLKIKKARAVALLISLGKTNARTFGDATLKEKLEDVQNWRDEDTTPEDASLAKLLDKLIAGFPEGLTVEIVADK